MEDDELKAIAPGTGTTMDVIQFVRDGDGEPKPRSAPVADLMETLKKRLSQSATVAKVATTGPRRKVA
jgi:hypothetical protein